MDFALFLLLNAVLLIRPEEVVPDLAGLRLYLIVIVLNVVMAAPRLAETLRSSELSNRPITVCVLGIWLAGILSQMVRGQVGLAVDFASEFGKVILYYLLLVSIIDTPGRLRAFLGFLVVLVVIIATLGQLQYHEYIDIPAMRPLERKEQVDPETGEVKVILQLRGTGIYNDPNDLCLILVTGSICALYRGVTAANHFSRVLWLLPIGLFGYSVFLTQSRGGLLGLMAAVASWVYEYFGWKKALPLCAVLLPGMALLSGGRQTDLNMGSGDTAYGRVVYWSEGLVALNRNPITGIGTGQFAEEVGIVAHNSFVHAYVEMGLFGGGLFLGAFYLGVTGLHGGGTDPSADLGRIRPFVLAILVGYAGGIFSLSRDYIVPTFLVLGLADVYLRCALPTRPIWFRIDEEMGKRLLIVGVVGLIGLKALTSVLLAKG